MDAFLINDGILEKYYWAGKEVVIPEGVTSIGKDAFRSMGITSVTIPEGVTSIGPSAFWGCHNLSRIYFPLSLTSIASNAFGLSGVQEIHYPNLEAWLKIGGLTKWIGYNVDLYINGELIGDLVLPDGLTEIKEKTFFRCKSITSVSIHASGSPIGSEAFPNIKYIGNSAFALCTNLKEFIIPEGVKELGSYAFSGCKNLESLTVPQSLISIDWGTFDECEKPKAVYFKGSVEAWISMDKAGWESSPFRNDAILYCNGEVIKDVVIPEGITSIGNGAFDGYKGLMSVTIPEGVTRIGASAFNATSISKLVIPASVNEIGPGALCCRNLKTITFMKSPTNFSAGWFTGYDRKVELVFPEDTFVTTEKLSADYCKADIHLSDKEIAYLMLYQKGKTWQAWLRTKVSRNASAVYDYLLTICTEDKKAPIPILAEFMEDHLQSLTSEQIKQSITLLDERKYKGTAELKSCQRSNRP